MGQDLLIVRFMKDYGIYAAQDQASFAENFAMVLVQNGIAKIIGPVDGGSLQPQLQQQQEVQLQLQLQPVVADDRSGRRK